MISKFYDLVREDIEQRQSVTIPRSINGIKICFKISIQPYNDFYTNVIVSFGGVSNTTMHFNEFSSNVCLFTPMGEKDLNSIDWRLDISRWWLNAVEKNVTRMISDILTETGNCEVVTNRYPNKCLNCKHIVCVECDNGSKFEVN